jgi:hypothetical protein
MGVGVEDIFNSQPGFFDFGQNAFGFVARVNDDAFFGFFTANNITIGLNSPDRQLNNNQGVAPFKTVYQFFSSGFRVRKLNSKV